MKLNTFKVLSSLVILAGTLLFSITPAPASGFQSVEIKLEPPAGTLRMGDTPAFIGTVTNIGQRPLAGLVVYLSLVSLEPGNEHPVDLEDWSAQKAVRIDRLSPGESSNQKWGMRLIQSGKYGVALTVVDPEEKRPIVSDLVPFDVNPKPTLASGRILPIAIGEPLLLLALLGALRAIRAKT